ncbi:hypothetical protein F2Q69_00017115 [Brassica cretica]|uniref:Cation/H+ exchanger domain-containing protein n=1 Tax=Brassica cretica TaxID=69181 RepID=A0A8S9QIS7_BRACR|nr:hypothetical protein F2Q69_00017115 [Brassica cretica]
MAEPPTSDEPNITYSLSTSRYGNIVCYNQTNETLVGDYSGWQSAKSIETALPFFVMQLLISNLSYGLMYSLTRPLHLPPFVAQILCGLLFSPTVLGRNSIVLEKLFPYRYTMFMETFANLALVYNMFLLGLGMDLRMIRIKQVKPMVIAIVGVVVALLAGSGLYYFPGNGDPDTILAGCLYWSVALSCTNFPDLARILADLKLLRSDMGHTAMSASIITDLCTWVLLVFGNACFNKQGVWNDLMPCALVSTIAFAFFCIYVIHPGIVWAFANTVKGGHVGENHVWFTLVGVVFCALITDAFGVNSITGAFLFGLSIPHDHIIRNMIEEKLHDFLSGFLMPLFYVICGFRVDLDYLLQNTTVGVLVFVISSCFMVKILSTVICSLFLGMPLRDGFAVGALMNTKGTMALVILNAGRDSKVLDVILYTHMTFAFLVMSIVVQPLLTFTYTPNKKLTFYKYRTVQKLKGEEEFRVLTCVHVLGNVPGITNLLHISNPTKKSPLNIYAIHLVELTGRTEASLLIMHDESKPKVNFSDRVRAESEQIAELFEGMEVNSDAVSVQTLTAVSPYATMHEDICTLAQDKQVSLILLPYHKNMTPDGRLGEGNYGHEGVNQNVLRNAPCSVGVLVDRGMTTVRSEASSFNAEITKKEIAMLFIGGRDDREALAYAWRMVGQEMVKLTVVRFVPGRDALVSAGKLSVEYAKEAQVDEECIYEFNFKTMNDSSVTCIEKVVNDGQEVIEAIREMEDNHSYDLYIVGRGYKVETPVTAGLTDWSSNSDLGTIGDTLASLNFTLHASVLVIQQYSAANRRTLENHQEHVKGGAKTANEAKMNSHEEEDDGDEHPTLLGENDTVLKDIFPYRYTMVLETFANLALVYNIFLLGLGMDLKMIKIKQRKPIVIAIVGLVVALLTGSGLYYLPGNGDADKIFSGCLYWSVALSCTNFPDLARILADLKLLRSDMGRTAMSASIITDLCTWVLLLLVLVMFNKQGVSNDMMLFALVSTIGFVFFCIYVIRPGVAWAFANTVKGGHVGENHVWFTLVGVIFCSLITEAFGVTSIPGAFLRRKYTSGLRTKKDHNIGSYYVVSFSRIMQRAPSSRLKRSFIDKGVERPVNQHNSISHYWIRAAIKHRDLGVDPDQQALRKAQKGNVAHCKPNRIVTADLSTPQDELTHAIECQKREEPIPYNGDGRT